MRKHFLILMLLALLPLSSWAATITPVKVYPIDFDKVYGDADMQPTATFTTGVTLDMFYCDQVLEQDVLTAIANKLTVSRIDEGEDYNSTTGYRYRLTKSAASVVVSDVTYQIIPQGEAKIYVSKKNISTLTDGTDIEIKLINPQYVDGTNHIEPAATDFNVKILTLGVNALNGNLTYDTDYVIDHYGTPNNTVAGGGTIFIAGKGNFTGTKELHFDISGVDISTIGTIAYTGAPLVYSKTPKTPLVTDFTFTKSDNSTLAAADHWRIKVNAYTVNDEPATYKDNLNAGKGKVTIEGIGDYSGEVEVEFPIAQYTVPTNGLEIDNNNPTYNGKAQLPTINSVKVPIPGTNSYFTLTENDYELTADENINAATTYYATIKFKEGGNFKGTAQVFSYSILKRNMSSVFKTVNTDNITYTGSEITPEYTLKVANEEDAYTLVLNKDFTLVQTNNKNAYDAETGKATIKFVAKANSNFTGETAAVEYQIGAATLTVTPQDIFASYGSSINPTVEITGWMTAADKAAGYTGNVTYTYKNSNNQPVANPTAVGTYTITPDYSALKATNYQFAIDENKLVGQLVISAGELVVKIDDQNVVYGGDADPYSVSYKSGLSTTDGDDFDANDVGNITYKLYDADGNEVAAAVNTLNVGTYKIKAVPTEGNKFTYTAAASTENINVIVADGTLTITKRPLNNNQIAVAVNNGTALTYNGYTFGVDDEAEAPLSVKLSGTEIVNTNNAQYTVQWVKSKDATVDVEAYAADLTHFASSTNNSTAKQQAAAAKWLAANTAKVVITATDGGNFSGSIEKQFTIKKKDLNVTANAGEWKYGNTEPTEWTSTIKTADLADPDKAFNPAIAASWANYKFKGSLKATRTKATGESVGEYYNDTPTDVDEKIGLYPSEISATNYNIIGHVGKLTISKGDLVLKVKDYEEKYGDEYNNDNFELVYAGGLTDPAKQAGWAQVVDQTHVTFTALDPADNETVVQDVDVPTAVGSTFKVKAEGATSTNYNITYETGTYTVVKRPIALKLKDQNIQLGQDIKRDNSETTDIITLVTPLAGNNFVEADGDNLNKLIEDGDIVVTIEPAGAELNATGVAQEGVIRATIDHAKYVLDEKNSVWGDLTVHVAAPLVISSTDENVLETIEGYDGASNIAVKFEGRSLNLGKWNVMVLPFDVTPYEFTQVLGRYAIFNTLKSANTANNTVSFGLELSELKANEPFLVKPEAKANDNATSIPVTDNNRKFEARTIVYPANGVPVKDDVAGVKFYGAYKAFNLEVAEGTADAEGFVDDGGEAGSKIMYLSSGAFVTATNTAKTKSMKTLPVTFTRGYLDFTESGMSNARIFVEEADGTTTAINGISADGTLIEADGWYSVNGVKLQNAPVEKGVYIHNGKKVVVK